MKFSVSLSLKHPLTFTQIQPPDWIALNQIIAQNTVQEKIAESTAQATWYTGDWTKIGAIVAAFALVAAIISAFYNWRALKISQKALETSQRALETWRGQVLGEHEFGRLLTAIQALHDIKATISDMRSLIIFEGEPDSETRGQQEQIQNDETRKEKKQIQNETQNKQFQSDLGQLQMKFLSNTFGLDILWGDKFITARDKLVQLIRAVTLAANRLYDRRYNQSPLPEHYALMGIVTHESQRPYGGVTSQSMVDDATKRIEDTISEVQLFLTEKLKAYAGINK